MTLENDSQYEMTRVWIARFQDTVRHLSSMRDNAAGRDRQILDIEIADYRYMIDDMKQQMADYEARTDTLAKAA
jgi:hypothetical protein